MHSFAHVQHMLLQLYTWLNGYSSVSNLGKLGHSMVWNLRLLKNATPRETQKISSLTMVIIYSWLFLQFFLGSWFWKPSFCCSDEQFPSEEDEEAPVNAEDSLVPYDSDAQELGLFHETEEEFEEQSVRADLGGGWGRIIYSPIRRGRQVQLDVCRATKRDASEGAFERVVITQSKNPTMHHQARRSLWGDLWPF